MSQFTITIYELERNGFDFGLDKYPIFDEEYRPILNDAILSYYRFREIGFQNPALWRERLQARMNLIMRTKYNELYEIKKTEFNPLYNIEIKETYTHELDSDNKAVQKNISDLNQQASDSSSRTNNALAFSSSFPSDQLMEDDLTDNLYVDNANKQTTTDTNTTDSNVNTTNIEDSTADMNTKIVESYTKFTEGSSAGLPFSKAMLQFKEYLLKYQLDQQVIDDLKDLFMTVWE